MFKIPIISISISESLKQFINKLVTKNKYDNKSKLIRDALLRLMSTEELNEASSFEYGSEMIPISKRITGNMIIVAPNELNVMKKINKIENEYLEEIVSKNQFFSQKSVSIFIVFEGMITQLQKIVVEFNSIKELKNFRYLIVN